VILPANEKIKYNSMYGPFIVVVDRILQNLSPSQIPKTVQLSTGKININEKLTFQPNTEHIELLQNASMPSL